VRDLPSGFIFCWPTSCGRLEIQYQARHTTKVPSEDNQAELERLCNIVTAKFAALEGILNGRSLLVTTGNYVPFDADSSTDFESHNDEDVPALAPDTLRQVLIELRLLLLPSMAHHILSPMSMPKSSSRCANTKPRTYSTLFKKVLPKVLSIFSHDA